MVKSSVSLWPETLNRLNARKGLYQSQQMRTIQSDEFISHLLDLFDKFQAKTLVEKDSTEVEAETE